jgi:hypothetical protein
VAKLCASSLELAGRWFLESGIQGRHGGVARYYRSDLGQNARVSTEITGYAVSTLLYLRSVTGDHGYLDAALRAGWFLTGKAWDRSVQTFPFEHPTTGADAAPPLAYFFDCGIILRGLLGLWRAVGEPGFLGSAVLCAKSMALDFAADESTFHPIVELPSKRPLAWGWKWSSAPGCYQLKAALSWYELCEQVGCTEYRTQYERLLYAALRDQESFLPGHPERQRVMDRLHAYSYFLEGLLPCVGEPECARALVTGIGRVSELIERIAPTFERSDVIAQLLRVRLFADALGVLALDREAARGEVERLNAFQAPGAAGKIAGGFYFGRKTGGMLPHVNPVSTAFCVQALEMWRQYEAGEFVPDWRVLI